MKATKNDKNKVVAKLTLNGSKFMVEKSEKGEFYVSMGKDQILLVTLQYDLALATFKQFIDHEIAGHL